ncbi:MAG: response regulator transcription factor [Clostridia bacterium]|nr:response regulator transcription factor [Clostridia bacterium]
MRIVICDDIADERLRLKNYIRRLEKDDALELEITEYSCGEDLLAAYGKRDIPDVLFLDVYMTGLTGVDVARAVKEKGFSGSIVFCTTSIDHAVESYRLKADGYLVKPYSYEDFLEAIWRCRKHLQKSHKGLTFTSERIEYTIPYRKITFIETSGRACAVHTDDGDLTTYKKIGEFEKELGGEASWLKVGRCFLVNMNRIKRLSEDALVFDSGDSVPLPSRDKKRLQQTVNDWFWRVARGENND